MTPGKLEEVREAFEGMNLDVLRLWVDKRETSEDEMPPELVLYLEQMERIYGWHQSMALEPEIIDNLLLHYSDIFGSNRTRAKRIYQDAINYFYLDQEIKAEAWGNVYADRLDKLAVVILKTAKNATELSRVKDIWAEAAKMRGVFNKKTEELPMEFYEKRTAIYTTRVKDLGLPELSRNEIAAMIDGLPLSGEQILDLKKDADLAPKQLLKWDHEES